MAWETGLLEECRPILEKSLAPTQVENLLACLLVGKVWRDRGYLQLGLEEWLGAGEKELADYLKEPLRTLAGLLAAGRETLPGPGSLNSTLPRLSLWWEYSPSWGPIALEEITDTYMALRQPGQGRRMGAYYSPPEVIDFILEHTLEPALEAGDPAGVTFIDPSCGCGYFLSRAYDRFKRAYSSRGIVPEEAGNLILGRNLFGVDLDPWALQLAALLLLEKGGQGFSRLNLIKTDALQKGRLERLFSRPSFSVAGGNPPHVTNYARPSQRLEQGYIDWLRPQYQFSRSRRSNRYNLAMFFLERFLDLLEPGGVAGLVIDGSGFHTTVYREVRDHLKRRARILHLVEGLEVFPGVNNRQAILVMEKLAGWDDLGSHKVSCRLGFSGAVTRVRQEEWSDSWRPPSPPEVAAILEKMDGSGCPLYQLYRPISGMNVTNRREAGFKPFLAQEPLDETYHKAVFSGNIGPYVLRWPTKEQEEARTRKRKYISYDRDLAREINCYLEGKGEKARVSIGKEEGRFRQPKVFVRQSLGKDRTVAAAYSEDPDHYCDNSVYVINQGDPRFSLFYLLSLLNSSLLTFYAREKGILSQAASGSPTRLPMGNKRGKGLRDFPIPPVPPARQKPLAELGLKMTVLGRRWAEADVQGDRKLVGELAGEMEKNLARVEEEVFTLYGLTPAEVKLVEELMSSPG